jgi:hypothetical protein
LLLLAGVVVDHTAVVAQAVIELPIHSKRQKVLLLL